MPHLKSIMQPSERSLKKALDDAVAGAGSPGKILDPPDFLSGSDREIESLSMNSMLADAERGFDLIYLPEPRQKHMQMSIDQVRHQGLRANGGPMRGLKVTGPTGAGKTTGINEYVAHLYRTGGFSDGAMPVLYHSLDMKTTVMKVLRAIVAEFGDRHGRYRDEQELDEQIRNCFKRAGVQLVIIDECQHLCNLTNDSQQVTNRLKVFLDRSIVPVIFVGTYDADPMFAANPELCGRLASPVDLAPLRWNDANDMALFTEFMRRLDEAMVDRKLVPTTSGLDQPFQIACLHLASGGVIGNAYRVVREAMKIALSRYADKTEAYDLALAVSRWAIPNKICTSNPFLREDLRRLIRP